MNGLQKGYDILKKRYDKIMGDCNDPKQLTNLLEECKKQAEIAKTNQALAIKLRKDLTESQVNCDNLQKDLADSQVKCDNEKRELEQFLKYNFQLERDHLNRRIRYWIDLN